MKVTCNLESAYNNINCMRIQSPFQNLQTLIHTVNFPAKRLVKIGMTIRAIELTEIKRDLANLPADKLAEVREYVRKLLPASRSPKKHVEPLRGIWKGLGWEKIDLEEEIRKLRRESSEHILRRFDSAGN
jgi:hypothetical protein